VLWLHRRRKVAVAISSCALGLIRWREEDPCPLESVLFRRFCRQWRLGPPRGGPRLDRGVRVLPGSPGPGPAGGAAVGAALDRPAGQQLRRADPDGACPPTPGHLRGAQAPAHEGGTAGPARRGPCGLGPGRTTEPLGGGLSEDARATLGAGQGGASAPVAHVPRGSRGACELAHVLIPCCGDSGPEPDGRREAGRNPRTFCFPWRSSPVRRPGPRPGRGVKCPDEGRVG
jgi:hypothetical protein